MALANWKVNKLKLSEVQEYAILRLGAEQTLQSVHRLVKVCTRGGGYGQESYWTGAWKYRSIKVPSKVKTKKKWIRVKTFLTLRDRGIISLSDTEPSRKVPTLFAQLTDFGWEVFEVLALENHRMGLRWDSELEKMLEVKLSKPKKWTISLTGHRKIMVPKFERCSRDFEIEAMDEQEAQRQAWEQFYTEYTPEDASRDNDWYTPYRVFTEVWGEDARKDAVKENKMLEFRKGEVEIEEDTSYKQRAKAELEKTFKMPWKFSGITAYATEGKRSPYLLEKMLKDSGGIRLTEVMAEDKTVEESTGNDAVGMDMARFSMLDLD